MNPIDTPAGWVRRLVAVIITMTATTAALVGASAPASAEACSSSAGVSVVIDFTGATGGVQSACVASGANTPAHQVIGAAGFALTWVQRQPGFICQVNGVPADSTCVNTPPPDAYWGVFWSDGKDGAWHYADVGVTGVEVPDGGYIGLAWQTGARREPGLPASAHPATTPSPTSTAPVPTSPTSGTSAPTTKPTTSPTTKPTPKPTPTASSTSGSASSSSSETTETPTTEPSSESPTDPPTGSPTEQATSPAPSSSATESPSATQTTSQTTEPTETPTEDAVPPEARTDEESSRVPTWLTIMILVLLLLAIGMSAYAARRRTHD